MSSTWRTSHHYWRALCAAADWLDPGGQQQLHFVRGLQQQRTVSLGALHRALALFQPAGCLQPPRLKMGIHAKQTGRQHHLCPFGEQYSLTKSSWLADYCKKEEQPPQPSAALSWMGPPPRL
ncbi:vacuolar protein sorting-associated protein 13D [Salmo salar]|uniref:Vacuolar protein sorting-associated protein 13D-like n=1 Tax=Salmo salar TaxID=8030 RepID=A0ABM3CZI5_SALSA|nr:vacuolar protein sorting-associated protein 13D-like [Salmo salar]XP_045551953.1 vacuolar protein sorting-associated protein 13D-like [Salmo salar]